MVDATLLQHELGLTLREYQVLDYIRSHRPRPIPCDEINEAIFGAYADRSRARRTITEIRRKLGASVIVTVHGFGVRFGLGAVVEANPRCPDCGRAIARYQDEWVCYGCGASGSRRQLESPDLEVGRTAYDPSTRSGQPWTRDEIDFVLANKDALSDEQMGHALGRPGAAVRGWRRVNHVSKRYILTRGRS